MVDVPAALFTERSYHEDADEDRMRPNESIDATAAVVQSASPNFNRSSAARRGAPRTFYATMSGALLLIVLVGFTPTLYLRPLFAGPDYPVYLLLHGVVLTAWYLVFFLQSALVAVRRTDLHRRLGLAGAGLGVAVLVLSLIATLAFVHRLTVLGADVDSRIAELSAIVWSDLASLLFFAVFLAMAIALRQRPEAHKRLMLLASISLIQPAVARISRWTSFLAIPPGVLSTAVICLLLLALGLYDAVSRKRLHPATLVGGSLFFGSKLLSVLVVSSFQFGRSFVRWLE
jgi:hypothetical protein